ncbi:hypothetical protein GOBAR_AA01171 [Gossypium barbadense]|uniref:Uncharacterized protein n=1 Tax=Gossypium barbadense TaxID=3634 RepID=A0A2P5YUW9_GOSBA|nr:hypothetical protein GOBAR_AA01171 [Gossypium barbadense]
MLSKFISVSETHFQNTEIALKNQQESIQGLETQIGSLPSNTEPNPREQLNAINIQNEEGFVEPEPEPWQKTMELDEWRTHKPRTHDKPKLHQNGPDTSPNQLKVGDKVLLDAADPHIVTTTPNEEILLTVLSIFPFGTVEMSHPKFDTFKAFDVVFTRKENCLTCFKEEEGNVLFRGSNRKNWSPSPTVQLADSIRALLTTDLWELFFGIIEPTYLELTMELCSTFHLQTVMTNYDDPGTVQFLLGELICQLSVPDFGAALGLYTKEFKEENELHALSRHIHFSPSKCWHTLAPGTAFYNPSCSKASVLPPSLSYIELLSSSSHRN